MSGLTVPQLAEACAPLNSAGKLDVDRLRLWIRRLRHWVVLGVLPAPAAGSGRYARNQVYVAAIILRLAGLGLPAPLLKLVSDGLQSKLDRRRTNFARFWREASSDSSQGNFHHYLLIRIEEEGEAVTVGISRSNAPQSAYFGAFDPGTDTVLVLNLNKVFSVVSPG